LQTSGWKDQKKILSCIFSEKLILEKGKVATYPESSGQNRYRYFSIPVRFSKNRAQKKEIKSNLLLGAPR